jgi:hypothetical protein
MKQLESLKDATPEQQKAVRKILFNGRVAMCGSTIKFSLGWFLANLISIAIGVLILKDVDPEMQSGFQMASLFINAVFMSGYLNRQLKKNSEAVAIKIQEVLKK